jgi:adenine deaminase
MNVQLVNVFTCEIYAADIGVADGRVAVVQPAGATTLEAREVVDGQGKTAVPGFVDTHVHIESTMVTPPHFAEAVLPLGTTSVIVDPHEIGNVQGWDGVKYMVEASEGLPLRVYITVPSCVPAVPEIETAGAAFGPADVAEMLELPRVVGVAEVMDYPGVINCSPRMEGIVEAGLEAGLTIQGHSPRLSGRLLNAYLAAGPESDHEIKYADEVLEKLRLGMLPLVKNSSYGNAIPEVARVLRKLPWAEVAVCTDDIEPSDLLAQGHMDRVVRSLIAEGIEPARAIRFATLNGARHYRLRDFGAIAPGYIADILLLSDLEQVTVDQVFISGQLVAQGGEMMIEIEDPVGDAPVQDTMNVPPLSEDAFKFSPPVVDGAIEMELLILEPTRLTRKETVTVEVEGGEIDLAQLGDDVCRFAIIPRHGQSQTPAMVAVKGLGLKAGAMASTISHDSHNLAVAGLNPTDMLAAAEALVACGGGLAAVRDGELLGRVALPVAGLMATVPVPELAKEVSAFAATVRELGLDTHCPALALAGLALPVVPHVRLTDRGLVDVAEQEIIPVFP